MLYISHMNPDLVPGCLQPGYLGYVLKIRQVLRLARAIAKQLFSSQIILIATLGLLFQHSLVTTLLYGV